MCIRDRAGGGRVGAAPPASPQPLGGSGTHPLGPGGARQHVHPGQKGGEATGPNPTDRGKPGTKRHLVTDAEGTPLGLTISGANRHDSKMLEATLDAVPGVSGGKRGRPRRRPRKLHADKAYAGRPVRRALRRRGIIPRIARKSIEDSQRLGRHRWVVERTIAWMARFRRLVVRYERRADIPVSYTHLTLPTLPTKRIV